MFLAKAVRFIYAQAELRRFILETGRTFGVLQIDPEPALKALVSEVTSEVGGLAVRHSPTGWKQAQGAVGTLQSNLYAQVRALKLDLEARYPGFDLPTKHPLFPWLVKHAQWLLNRYAQKSDGLTPFEKHWSKPYSGSPCRFAEVVHFRKAGKFPKSLPAWEEGLWLGRDTESNQHFVATAQGVHKTRSLRRRPPSEQVQKDLLESLRAKPWDPKGVPRGNRQPTTLCFLLWARATRPRECSHLTRTGSRLPTVEEAPAEEVEHFHGMPPMSETRTSADMPVPEDVDLDDMTERLPDELFKRPLEEVPGASGASSSTSRRRLEPPPTFERKRETSEVSEAASKLQRISSVFRTSDHPMRLFDLRVSAVTTKQALGGSCCGKPGRGRVDT